MVAETFENPKKPVVPMGKTYAERIAHATAFQKLALDESKYIIGKSGEARLPTFPELGGVTRSRKTVSNP